MTKPSFSTNLNSLSKEKSIWTGHFLQSLFLAHKVQRKLFQGHINTQIILIQGESRKKNPLSAFGDVL